MKFKEFLLISREEMIARGWYYYDFLVVTGDAYVDHPSFGAAVIARVLEADGFRVAVLAQPKWTDAADFADMGRPRYAVFVGAGNLDSMVARYTAAKKTRSEDFYSPGKRAGLRPDRASIVYALRAREAFPGLPVVLGGLEASLRRFAHYDYWEDKVRRPVLFDAKADMLVYGMGETATRELARRLSKGEPASEITDVRGTAFIAKDASACKFQSVACASFEEVTKDRRAYAEANMLQYDEHDPVRGRAVVQKCAGRALIVNPPVAPLETAEFDRVSEL
ncbi:MAG: YgiQ family radical SAM protein, partial [Oscillospiraceae bacterium]|nr:YgiQ family radical SAM protein [Oscillospiraceae bacterium]